MRFLLPAQESKKKKNIYKVRRLKSLSFNFFFKCIFSVVIPLFSIFLSAYILQIIFIIVFLKLKR